MKEKVLELYNAGHNVNKIAAMLMIQKSEVEKTIAGTSVKKNEDVDVVSKKK